MISLSEHNIQASFVDSVLWQYRNDPTFLRPLFFSVPNGAYLGGKNRPAVFQKLKSEGFFSGVTDMLYLQSRGDYPYLALEFKTEKRRNRKGGGLSEDQIDFIEAALQAGAKVAICYSVDSAIEVFADYMRLAPNGIPSGSISDMIESATQD